MQKDNPTPRPGRPPLRDGLVRLVRRVRIPAEYAEMVKAMTPEEAGRALVRYVQEKEKETKKMTKNFIITRHAGLIAWLKREGIYGDMFTHVLPDGETLAANQCHESDLIGQDVFGMLPMRLAALTNRYFEVDFVIPPSERGKEFTPEQMDIWGAKLSEYKVVKK